MAHHVASLIDQAEHGPSEQRASAQKECFETILALWRHRSELPSGTRPFEEIEPIVRTIRSLDPEDPTPRYFRAGLAPGRNDKIDSNTEVWLKAVDGLDQGARLLIGYCLSRAAGAALDKSEEWVNLAGAAGMDDGALEIVVRYISHETGLRDNEEPSAKARKLLEDRLSRLTGLNKLALQVARDLKVKLSALPKPKLERQVARQHNAKKGATKSARRLSKAKRR